MGERSRANVSANIYEDFQLQVERKEEQGANILIIHLPGFPKEQINVTYVDSSRTIKVEGERAVEKNKRRRFNQAFPVPQNCIIAQIHAGFRNGVLTITMPKQTINQTGSVQDATSANKETSPPKPMSQQKPMKEQQNKTTSPITDHPKASMEQNAPPKVVEALKPSNLQEETLKKAAAAANIATTSTAAVEKKKPKKVDSSSFLEKAKEMKGMDTIMKTIKRFGGDDYEDRQLMMNIGVSVLVIVALGAYITYSYRSSG